ncbi:YetF domain-containing protein [uncultured Flavobacterium sp.]|uniref:DUF421 domain-containing protein n=1 Tax=uncultured Flavobacterium sp. TaxID=165435 RepID=UPI0025E720B0|nr:YetF domain-containing protein [uncultured Flavobacterium sp.]
MENIFFKDWGGIKDVALCSVIAFLTVFILVRLSGKRTLAKLNAFDFIVTVTLGSTLSSMILAKVTLTEGTVALIIIIIMQYALAWLAGSSTVLEKAINSKPSLLYYNGRYIEDEMKREGITKEEILAEIRSYRLERMEDVKAVVLELNGEFSVIKKSPLPVNASSLDDENLTGKE